MLAALARLYLQADEAGLGRGDGAANDGRRVAGARQRYQAPRAGRAAGRRLRGERRGGRVEHVRERYRPHGGHQIADRLHRHRRRPRDPQQAEFTTRQVSPANFRVRRYVRKVRRNQSPRNYFSRIDREFGEK